MKSRALFLVVALAVLVSGCSRPQTPAPARGGSPPFPSVPATEALAGGGERATLVQGPLRFTVETSSTLVSTRQGIAVRLTLTNIGHAPVHWDDFRFGWEGPTSDGGTVSIGLGISHLGLQRSHPLTLGPGQTKSLSVHTGSNWHVGDYHVSGGFEGEGGPYGRAPEIIVRLTK